MPLSQPCRAVDTRPSQGGMGPILGGTSRNFPISGEGACAALPNAAVYSMNVTVVPSNGTLGYLTVWPAGQTRPVASTLNSVDGRVKADAVIVPAGANGAVSIYVTDTTNVIVDVNGYFAPVTGSTLAFYPLGPCRVADTRNGTFPPGLGPAVVVGRRGTAVPHTECRDNVQHSCQRRSGVFAELYGGAQQYARLLDRLADRSNSAYGFHLERRTG